MAARHWIGYALVAYVLMPPSSPALGATLTNLDAEPFVMTVTEQGLRTDVKVEAGESIEFCLAGCFVALPNGNRAALNGSEIIEVSGGKITAK